MHLSSQVIDMVHDRKNKNKKKRKKEKKRRNKNKNNNLEGDIPEETITIMVYYTPEFEQEFENPQAVIKSHIAATNDAFIQSGLGNVQLQIHCTEKIDVMDSKSDDAKARLNAFNDAKGGDIGYILNSADIAMLMTATGVSKTNMTTYGTLILWSINLYYFFSD